MVAHVARLPVTACLCGLAFVAAAQADDPAPLAGKKDPAVVAVPPASAERRAYPQVNMAGCRREYRAMPLDETEVHARIRAALRAPIPQAWDFEDVPLRAVLEHIRHSTGLPIVADMVALGDRGIDLDSTSITKKLTPDTRLGAALRMALHDAGLTWTVANDALTVTTKEKAQEQLEVVVYPLPRGFGERGPLDFQSMIVLLESTVAPSTWDVVGGMGAIKPLDADGDPLLVVSQTGAVHDEIECLLRAIHERLLAEFAAGTPVLKVHRVADAAARQSLAQALVGLCNKALAEAADDQAEATVVGDSVAVLSKSPEFHALAARVVAAVDGVADPTPVPPDAGSQGNPDNRGFCWVAREVYGADDPRWLVVRGWVLTESPSWFRDAYGRYGAGVAMWLRDRPVAKAAVRVWMNGIVRGAVGGG